jgi:hypothetical protein
LKKGHLFLVAFILMVASLRIADGAAQWAGFYYGNAKTT